MVMFHWRANQLFQPSASFNTFARILSSRFLFSSSLLPSPLHEELRIQLGLKKERRVESSIVEISISINAKEQFSRFNPSFPLSLALPQITTSSQLDSKKHGIARGIINGIVN